MNIFFLFLYLCSCFVSFIALCICSFYEIRGGKERFSGDLIFLICIISLTPIVNVICSFGNLMDIFGVADKITNIIRGKK